MLRSTPSGLSEGPLGLVWPSLPHLVSRCLEFDWQLHRGFPSAPSVGCGFPYHIWSLLPRSLLATASGVSENPRGRVWPSLPHLVSTVWNSTDNCFGGFPSAPSVGCGLPYLISSLTLWESAGNCIGGFPSAPSVGCGFPYHIWSLAVWKSAGNCIGGFREPPRSGVAFLTTSGLHCLEFY